MGRAALEAMDWEDLGKIVATFRDDGAGPPVPAFDDLAAEAGLWADHASRDELKAYAVAIFRRMQPRDRDAFLAFVQRRSAA